MFKNLKNFNHHYTRPTEATKSSRGFFKFTEDCGISWSFSSEQRVQRRDKKTKRDPLLQPCLPRSPQGDSEIPMPLPSPLDHALSSSHLSLLGPIPLTNTSHATKKFPSVSHAHNSSTRPHRFLLHNPSSLDLVSQPNSTILSFFFTTLIHSTSPSLFLTSTRLERHHSIAATSSLRHRLSSLGHNARHLSIHDITRQRHRFFSSASSSPLDHSSPSFHSHSIS